MNDYNVKKILITTDVIGGVWSFTLDLCKFLSEHNISIILVITGEKPTPSQLNEISVYKNIIVEYKGFKLEWMPNSRMDIELSIRWIQYLVNFYKPDLIHFNSYSFAKYKFEIPTIITAHSCVYSWYDAVKERLPYSEWNDYFYDVKEGLTNADLITAPSNYMKDYINKFYLTNKEIKVVYNGREPKIYSAGIKQPYVFSMGRIWDEAKNFKMLFESASEIKSTILIAGDYENFNTIKGYSKNLAFLGKLSSYDIIKFLSKALIYVHTSKYEPFGLAPLEAALSKCTLVLHDIISLRELWGDNAIYFKTKEELILKINDLLKNIDKAKKYSEKCYKKALEYSLDKMGNSYFLLYNKLTSEKIYS